MSAGQEPPPIWWVRYKVGTVGQTHRVTHAVPVPDGFPEVLTAYCGQKFLQGHHEFEIVEPGTGQPCNGCLLFLPLPEPRRELTRVSGERAGVVIHQDG
jgi:hypothetical protein